MVKWPAALASVSGSCEAGRRSCGIGKVFGAFGDAPAICRRRRGGNLREVALGQRLDAGMQLSDAGRLVILAVEEGIGLVAVAPAGRERGGVGDVVAARLHEQLGLAVPGIHRLAGGGIGIEVAAGGVELDREIVAVAQPHAERSRAAGHRHVAAVAGKRIAEAGDLGLGREAEGEEVVAAQLTELAAELVHLGHDRRALPARPRAEEEEAAGAIRALGGHLRLGELLAELVDLDHFAAADAEIGRPLERTDILRLQAVAIAELEPILGARRQTHRDQHGKRSSSKPDQPHATHGVALSPFARWCTIRETI